MRVRPRYGCRFVKVRVRVVKFMAKVARVMAEV